MKSKRDAILYIIFGIGLGWCLGMGAAVYLTFLGA